MKKRKLSRLVPPGMSGRHEVGWTVLELAAAVGCNALAFFNLYYERFKTLAEEEEYCKRIGTEMTMKMWSFKAMAGGCGVFYLIVVIIMAFMCLVHCIYYFKGAKSIYLIRRLPQKGAFIRYTFGLPALGAALSAVCFLAVRLILLAVYYTVTPAAWLPV